MPGEIHRQIEELLDRLDDFIPEEKPRLGLQKWVGEKFSGVRFRLRGLFSHVSLGHLMALSLVLVFFAFMFRSASIGQYALIAGLALLGATIAVSFFRNRRRSQETRWRGQAIDLSRPGPLGRLQGWLRNRRGR